MKKAGDLLPSFMDEKVLTKAKGYSSLFSSWASVAGEKAACHSRIMELEKSVLLVEADHPGWVQILQTKQAYLLKTLQKRFPELSVKAISFRLCRDPASFAAASPPGSGKTEDAAAMTEDADFNAGENIQDKTLAAPAEPLSGGEDPYESIRDEAFRETLKRLERALKTGKKRS
ncbi:DUF721 domain-containing protein [Treponema sp. OttesenSCG-928-L16]|nr:DUF721 domain-containing protein [Treponema sp. OttesenSCG-928-L16]